MRFTLLVATCLVLGSNVAVAQLSDEDLNELREEFASYFTAGAGAFYAASVNFTVNPDVSATALDLDDDASVSGLGFDGAKVPLRFRLDTTSRGWTPFLQLQAGRLGTDAAVQVLPDGLADVETRWRTRGVSVSAGIEIPLNERWTVIPAVDLGWARVSNKARYSGALGDSLIRPILEGIAFDWEADAWIAGAALGARYNRPFERFRLHATASASTNRVSSYESDSRFIDFAATASTLDVELNTVHALPWEVAGSPVELVTIIGASRFIGSNADALGFDALAEFGAAVQFDLASKRWVIDGLRLGVKAIVGEDLNGWSLVLGKPL